MGQVVNVAKYKIAQEVNDVAKHNLRCYIPKNVDPERQKDNIYFVGHQGQRGIHRLMAEKLEGVVHRKDANKVVNLVFGASNEEFEKMGPDKANKWAKEINDYCIKKFGKENVLYSVLHNDETTRHLFSLCHYVKVSFKVIIGLMDLRKFHNFAKKYIKSTKNTVLLKMCRRHPLMRKSNETRN